MFTYDNFPRLHRTMVPIFLLLMIGVVIVSPSAIAQDRAVVTLAPGVVERPLDGRVLLMLSKSADREPGSRSLPESGRSRSSAPMSSNWPVEAKR